MTDSHEMNKSWDSPSAEPIATSTPVYRTVAPSLDGRGESAAFPLLPSMGTTSVAWKVIALLVLLTTFADALLISTLDLTFPPGDLVRPLFLAGVLFACAYFYRYIRPAENFTLAATAMAFLVLFSASYSVLMYCVAATGSPLVDSELAAIDGWFGFSVPAVMQWTASYPVLAKILALTYDTLLPQTALVVIILGLGGNRNRLQSFLLMFVIATLMTAVVFYFFPADGPFTAYGYAPSAMQAIYLDHFHALRSGDLQIATWRGAQGLITFPSFHTTWAILLTLAFRGRRFLFPISLALNFCVILSTITTGWHYLSDVIGGVVVAGMALSVMHLARNRLQLAPCDREVGRSNLDAVQHPAAGA